MALAYPPCLGEAHILVRPTSNLSFTAYSDNLSASLSFRTPFWSIGTRKYQQRRYRKSFLLPSQKHAIKTSQKLWRVRAGPTASLAQSSRTVVASETLLSFSYLPPALNREDGSGNGNGEGGLAYSSSTGVVDAREMRRRERIARANKGKVPWNKGRRHSPETIAKIRERTKKAMLNPKVREKLRNFGKNQSVETKEKIREKMVGVWESKKLIKKAQDTMFKEWKELVANAARVGDSDDEEHEWDTYTKLLTQLRRDVSDAARRAKQVVVDRRKANTQARKAMGVSEAHRKAISDAIKAKWEDPEYRARVFSGMRKTDPATRNRSTRKKPQKKSVAPQQKALVFDEGVVAAAAAAAAEEVPVPVPVEKRKVSVAPAVIDEDFIAEVLAEEVTAKSRSESATAARIKGPQKVTLVRLEDNSFGVAGDKEEAVIESQIVPLKDATLPVKGGTVQAYSAQSISVGKKNVEETVIQPSKVSYKDPLVHEKLQKIKQLREGRLEVEAKRKEAANRARMLIADAERAANALERAAKSDKATMATLIETRRLIAEATRSMQAAERVRTPDGDANTDSSGPKHMASIKTSPHPISSDLDDNEEISALSIGSNFHRRVWTSSDNMVECPHPIPLRVGDLRSGNLELRMSELKAKFQNVRSGSVAGWVSSLPDLSRNTKPTFDVSTGNQEHDQAGKEEPYPTVVDESLQNEDGQGFLKHSSSSSSGKKKWVRGRLVSTDEENRT